jgi:ribosomal protein S18 acetylase RimI-like enzyme
VGVTPEDRGEGLGRTLYERFFDEARAQGRSVVRCVTSPLNQGSLAFHEALGFEVERIAEDYDGPGEDRALLVKQLT